MAFQPQSARHRRRAAPPAEIRSRGSLPDPSAHGGEPGSIAAPLLAEIALSAHEVARVRHVLTHAGDILDIRLWRRAGPNWLPAEGFMLPAEQLPEFRRLLAHAAGLLGERVTAASPEAMARTQRERVRTLARQVALARERLESLRPEDYQRPQDYRRVRTLRLVELHRQESVLARAQAGLEER